MLLRKKRPKIGYVVFFCLLTPWYVTLVDFCWHTGRSSCFLPSGGGRRGGLRPEKSNLYFLKCGKALLMSCSSGDEIESSISWRWRPLWGSSQKSLSIFLRKWVQEGTPFFKIEHLWPIPFIFKMNGFVPSLVIWKVLKIIHLCWSVLIFGADPQNKVAPQK